MKKLSLIITAVLLSVIVRATESFVLFQPSADALTRVCNVQLHPCKPTLNA